MEENATMGCINLHAYLENNSQPYDQQIYIVMDPDSFINGIIHSYLGLLHMEQDNLLPYSVDLFLNDSLLFTTNGENQGTFSENWNIIVDAFHTTTDTDLPNDYSSEEYHGTPCINITIKPSSTGGRKKSRKSQKKSKKSKKSKKLQKKSRKQKNNFNKKGGNDEFNVKNVDVSLLLSMAWFRSLDKHERYVYLNEVLNTLNEVLNSGKRSKTEIIQMMNNPEFLLKFYENIRDNLVSDGILARPEIDFAELERRF